MPPEPHRLARKAGAVRIFLGGDILTGGAIDQLFATHNDEEFGKAEHRPAREYFDLSAKLHGPVEQPVGHEYIWGVAPGILDAAQPDFRLANLETSITTAASWEPKGYSYRMHPDNVGCLAALGLDCVSLANNHVLDFGIDGMIETIDILHQAGIGCCGAGIDEEDAARPHIHILPSGKRILVFSWGFRDSHIVFPHWAAGPGKPGIQWIEAIGEEAAKAIAATINSYRKPDDHVIASLHWGANWVSTISGQYRAFARSLIDEAGVDLIHGHSSHHVLPVETHRGRLIFYGCGDLIGDSEGHPFTRSAKGHLGALYFVDIDAQTHRIADFKALPVERRRFRLELPSREDTAWMHQRIGAILQDRRRKA